ncbi:hypothetical protein LCGC14_2483300, partial [marine sediment metagenome]
MTATEMGYEFDVGYDKITNFDAPGYEPKEKSIFLTKAQEELVLNVQKGSSSNEFNKRVLDILKTKVEILAAAMSAGPYNNSFWATLPTTAFGIVNERATLTPSSSHFYYDATTPRVFTDVRVKPIDDDYYHLNIKNPHKKPTHELVWRLDYGELDQTPDPDAWINKLVYVIESNEVLTGVQIHYYRKPVPIIVKDAGYVAGDGSIDGVALVDFKTTEQDCELNKITHREIIDKAVKLGYAALQDEKG